MNKQLDPFASHLTIFMKHENRSGLTGLLQRKIAYTQK